MHLHLLALSHHLKEKQIKINNIWLDAMNRQYTNDLAKYMLLTAVSFIGGGNQSTWKKPLTCCKSLTNSIT
jgi:hypothetical protein